QQVGGLGVLDQEAAGPGTDRLVDVLVGLEGGQDDHLDPGQVVVGGDAAGGLQAVHPGHPDIHQHHVGALAEGQVDRLGPVGGLADDLEVVGGVNEHVESGADQRLVVGEQDADHGRVPSWAAAAGPAAAASATGSGASAAWP